MGYRNPARLRHLPRLPAPGAGPCVLSVREPRMPALLIRQGPNAGTAIPLAHDRFVIGRNPDCGVIIPITSVSREHATILRLQGRFFIEDGDGRGNKSRNGTFVNKQAINSRTLLKNNDEI